MGLRQPLRDRLTHMCHCDGSTSVTDSVTCVPWRIHIQSFIRTAWKTSQGTHFHDRLSPMCVTWRIHMYAMTHSFILSSCKRQQVTSWLIHMTWFVPTCHAFGTVVTSKTHTLKFEKASGATLPGSFMWELGHSCENLVWHHFFVRVAWLIHTFDWTSSFMWHDSAMCVTWLIHMHAMTHIYTHSCTHTSRTHTYTHTHRLIHVTWLRHMCHMPHPYVCYGVATISRLLKIIGLFCKRAL